jgi:hypothetical protein
VTTKPTPATDPKAAEAAKPAQRGATAREKTFFNNLDSMLRLYENTLAQVGVVRNKSIGTGELTRDRRLGHARYMIDEAIRSRSSDPIPALADFRFIQGILWAENVFSAEALAGHAHQLYAG